jgi:hypothetical protein
MSSRQQRVQGSELCPLGPLRDHRGSHLATDNVLRNDKWGGLAIPPTLWPDDSVLEMARTMLYMFVPGAFLGFTMMPWWWLLAAAASIVAALLFWRRGRPDRGPRSKALLIGSGSSVLAIAFYVAAVWHAKEGCSQPPADGFCMFDGLPFLSLCALYLLVGLVAWIKWARLRA